MYIKFSVLYRKQYGTWMSGGAGYILSREAFVRLVQQFDQAKRVVGTPMPGNLPKDFWASPFPEDAAVGLLMQAVGAK